jgi:ORF6N domain
MPKAAKHSKKTLPAIRPVEGLIHIIRGQKVMLDTDLAALYEVPTKRLNEAVRRNLDRFPEDLMFQLTTKEADSLRSQFATSNTGRGGRRYAPYVFTEYGVVMLSSVLNSKRAIRVNLMIVRAFVRMRELITHHKDIEVLVEDIDKLAHEVKLIKNPPPGPKRKIGFIFHED